MPPSRLIIDLNRCFEPNAFNTGPPIPDPHQQVASNEMSVDTSTRAESIPDTSIPDLTSSPTSSTGSSLHSASLEDEEIRRIFANPEFDSSQTDVSLGYYDVYAPIQREEVYYFSGKDDLNPHAAPFVPSFARSTTPLKLMGIDSTFQPSPLDLGFEPLNFAYPSTPSNQSPHPFDLPHREYIPLPPRSARSHLPFNPDVDEPEPEPATAIPGPQSSPMYLPLLVEAFHPETPDRLRKVLAHAIVNSTATTWDLDTLLELAERIGQEACKPSRENHVMGSQVLVCHASRYIPVENGSQNLEIRGEEFTMPEQIVADVALHLYNQFTAVREELGQAFVWNLRETVLTRFICCWDDAKPTSIDFKSRPPVHYVRSALALCKSIAALFTRNLITHNHVSMCLSILMRDLMSVEHFDALANIVLGAGPTFWGPMCGDTITRVEVNVGTGVLPLADGSLLLSTSKDPATTRVLQNDHVTYFLSGLVANVVGRNLKGEESVVGHSWGKGQLAARIREVVDSVKLWESIVMNPSIHGI